MGDPGVSIVEDCWRAGLVTGTGDDMMRIGGVKLFLDGSAGGRTAWMSRPYKDEPGNFGVQMLPAEEVERLVMQWHRCGYSLACHAIGDAAIDQLVTAYEKALAQVPDSDRRHRVEHCGFLAGGLNERMKAAGIYPAPQLAFVHDFGDSYISVMDEERARSCYPSATWKRMGLGASTGSDSPVCSPDPFPNIHAMITRQTWKGTVMDEAERLAPDEVLQAYTEGGAFMEKAEHVKGRLVPGQLADIAVFNNNLLEAAPATIRDQTHCVLTILGGEVVHDRRG
jgi:predicted amidohydrolase YtcJ